MRARLAILGLGLWSGCQGGGAPTSSVSTVESAPASSPAPRETASAVAAPRSSTSSSAPSAPGAIAKLKADSLREMDAMRGKRVEVSGVFIKRTVARSGGMPSEHPLHINNTVWLADTKDGSELLRCDLGESWASGVQPMDRITVEGIAAFEDPSTIHNGPKELRVTGCKVEKAR